MLTAYIVKNALSYLPVKARFLSSRKYFFKKASGIQFSHACSVHFWPLGGAMPFPSAADCFVVLEVKYYCIIDLCISERMYDLQFNAGAHLL